MQGGGAALQVGPGVGIAWPGVPAVHGIGGQEAIAADRFGGRQFGRLSQRSRRSGIKPQAAAAVGQTFEGSGQFQGVGQAMNQGQRHVKQLGL